jgi:hypothetical protein
MDDDEADKPPPMLLLLMVPLPLLGMTPVTCGTGVLTTSPPVAAICAGTGMEALGLSTTGLEVAVVICNSLLLAVAFKELIEAGAAGKRFGTKRRPKDGENVFRRPLTASVRESCICKRNAHDKDIVMLKCLAVRVTDYKFAAVSRTQAVFVSLIR